MLKKLKSIPEQVIRLAVILVIIVVVFVIVRAELVPDDFGELGHYRKGAVDEIASLELKYAGQETCEMCHDDILETKSNGYHRSVNCEVCHGPSAKHSEAPDEFLPSAPRKRDFCPVCHEYLPSRPTGFPQIVSASHNPVKPCITCHEPHNPVPPETPHECSACHAEISRVKSISHHAYLECKTCHEVPEQHKLDPRGNAASKPATREFCGKCHAEENEDYPGVPQIDLAEHEPRYVCWQCHYPHMPEAK
ncbi:MAG: hypothetical protein KKA84_10835 [Bacteroidetes bacterium]|nr:hypothetical protein [Bacteroidota bacterium]